MQPISFSSRDGLTIHGYLTLPKGVAARNIPTVLVVHGGPWARDTWGYDPEVQFLANRGFAVLQINYRGSTGYGKKFLNAGNRERGGKMLDDLIDSADWIVRQGIADKKRLGIYGGSYGGYATLSALAFRPKVFACGVDYVGVSNLLTFMNTIPPYWETFRELMYKRVGNPKIDQELLRRRSPLFAANKIEVPLFVAQGYNDPRVNHAEAEQIVHALKANGKPVEYLLKMDEEEIRHIRGNRIAMVFQEPMTSLNPLHTLEKQIAETQWLTEINKSYGFPGAIVAHAWFLTENAEEILAAQSQFPLVRGIRSNGRSRRSRNSPPLDSRPSVAAASQTSVSMPSDRLRRSGPIRRWKVGNASASPGVSAQPGCIALTAIPESSPDGPRRRAHSRTSATCIRLARA
jgi:ABC-type dipeptide/oligopeptide/nickel transport system ATPase component